MVQFCDLRLQFDIDIKEFKIWVYREPLTELLKVTWQVFCVTSEVYDVRLQRGEVGFHVCHLPESF